MQMEEQHGSDGLVMEGSEEQIDSLDKEEESSQDIARQKRQFVFKFINLKCKSFLWWFLRLSLLS